MIAQQANLYDNKSQQPAAGDDSTSTGSLFDPGLRMVIDSASVSLPISAECINL